MVLPVEERGANAVALSAHWMHVCVCTLKEARPRTSAGSFCGCPGHPSGSWVPPVPVTWVGCVWPATHSHFSSPGCVFLRQGAGGVPSRLVVQPGRPAVHRTPGTVSAVSTHLDVVASPRARSAHHPKVGPGVAAVSPTGGAMQEGGKCLLCRAGRMAGRSQVSLRVGVEDAEPAAF